MDRQLHARQPCACEQAGLCSTLTRFWLEQTSRTLPSSWSGIPSGEPVSQFHSIVLAS